LDALQKSQGHTIESYEIRTISDDYNK